MNILVKIKTAKLSFYNLVFKKTFLFSVGTFFVFCLFIYTTQPAELSRMNAGLNKLILILLLGFTYSIISFFQTKEIKQLGFSIKQWKKILVKFGFIAIIISFLILYVTHPYVTKIHPFRYFFTLLFIVAIFQIISFYLLITKLHITSTSSQNKYYTFFDNKTTVKIPVQTLLFIKASGNYVEIFEENKVHLIRSTLKNIANDTNYSALIRCHKSYVINKNKIQKIIKNKKGYKVKLNGYNEYIPVSTKIAEELKFSLRG